MFLVKQEQFEGPMGVLLDLIEKEKLSINEISLARVADEYLAFVKGLQVVDKEELAEFLVVAAQLILIKTRSLLPNLNISEEETLSIEELQARLEEYKRLKELSREIRNLESKKQIIYTREFYTGLNPVFYPPKKISVGLMRQIFAKLMASLSKIERLKEEKIKKVITLEEKIKDLQFLLQEKIEKAFSEIVAASRDKIEIIVSFLAILELARQKFLSLKQDKLFGEIRIRKE